MPRKLIKNSIKCLLCDEVLESKHVHDFQQCSCESCFIDGGLEYVRIGGAFDHFEDLSEWEELDDN